MTKNSTFFTGCELTICMLLDDFPEVDLGAEKQGYCQNRTINSATNKNLAFITFLQG